MSDSIYGILARFKESLAADKKKTAILCVLFVVLVVVLVRQLFSGSTVEPAAAAASLVVDSRPIAAQTGALVRPTVEAIRSAPSSRSVAVAPPRKSAERQHPTAPPSEKVASVVGLPRTLSRNIFDTPNWSRFAYFAPPAGSRGPEGEATSSLLTRIRSKLATYGRSRREEVRKVDEDLAKLRLESTMTGQAPLAHISGRLVREGDQVDGFSVVHIGDRQVMLRKAGVTRVLSMP